MWETNLQQANEKKVKKQFLRPNFVNIYNFDMNSVDRADHLMKNYCLGEGLRQRKWWFSIFLWGLDVAMVNLYLVYTSWIEMHKLTPIDIIDSGRVLYKLGWIRTITGRISTARDGGWHLLVCLERARTS